MKLKVRTLAGHCFLLESLSQNISILEMKNRLEALINVPKEQQRIFFKGKILVNGSLRECNVGDGDFVVVIPTNKFIGPPRLSSESVSNVGVSSAGFSSSSSSTMFSNISSETPSLPFSFIPNIDSRSTISLSASYSLSNPVVQQDALSKSTMQNSITDKTMIETQSLTTQFIGIPNHHKDSSPSSEGCLTFSGDSSQVLAEPQSTMAENNSIISTLSSISSSNFSAVSTPERTSVQLPSLDNGQFQQLVSMGFSEEAVRKALFVNKMSIQLSMDWLLEHAEDTDINEPPTDEMLKQLSEDHSSFEPNPVYVEQLKDMGFSNSDIENALRITKNNYERAAAWLLGDREDIVESDEDKDNELALDYGNPIVRAILSSPEIQTALENPRILQGKLQRGCRDISEIIYFCYSCGFSREETVG